MVQRRSATTSHASRVHSVTSIFASCEHRDINILVLPVPVLLPRSRRQTCMSHSISLSAKRIKLDQISPQVDSSVLDDDLDHCTICLQSVVDRTVVPTCSHEFCFECLLVWTGNFPATLFIQFCSGLHFRAVPAMSPLLSKRGRILDPPHPLQV